MKNSISFSLLICLIIIVSLIAIFWALFPISYISATKKECTKNQEIMEAISNATIEYTKKYKQFPVSLNNLLKDEAGIKWLEDIYVKDAWDNPIVYKTKSELVLIKSYGKDGKSNGMDLNTDWIYKFTIKRDFNNKIKIRREIISKPLW